jgi:hypothetical protein
MIIKKRLDDEIEKKMMKLYIKKNKWKGNRKQ